MRARWAAVLMLGSCTGPDDATDPCEALVSPGDVAEDLGPFFPLNGTRQWDYARTGDTAVAQLTAASGGPATIRFDRTCGSGCESGWWFSLDVQVTDSALELHAVNSPDGDETFSPPVVLAPSPGGPGATAVSEADAACWTTGVEEALDCAVPRGPQPECLDLVVASTPARLFNGRLTLARDLGIVRLDLGGEAWSITSASFEE